MDYNGVRKERAIEHLETATCSPTTADEKYICNRGGAFLTGRVWDTFILFAMHVTLLYKTESNNLKKMDIKTKKERCKEADLLPDLHTRGLRWGRNSKTRSRGVKGAPFLAADDHHKDGADGAGAPGWEDAGQLWTAPQPVGEHRVPRGEPVFPAVGCPGRQRGEGWGGSGDVFKCISLYICSLNAYGTGRQSIWALHNN